MKKLLISLTTLLAFFLVSCGGSDDNPGPVDTPQQSNARLLAEGSWAVTAFTVPAGLTNDYSDLVIDYSANLDASPVGGTFTTSNGSPLFPSSGTWSFVGTGNSTIEMTSGGTTTPQLVGNITQLNATTFVLNVEASDPSGRTTTIFGDYTFSFVQQQ